MSQFPNLSITFVSPVGVKVLLWSLEGTLPPNSLRHGVWDPQKPSPLSPWLPRERTTEPHREGLQGLEHLSQGDRVLLAPDQRKAYSSGPSLRLPGAPSGEAASKGLNPCAWGRTKWLARFPHHVVLFINTPLHTQRNAPPL